MIYFQSLTKDELASLILPLSKIKRPRFSAELSPKMSEEDLAQLEADLEKKALRQSKYRAQQIFHWVYQRFVADWDQMTDLSKELREWLKGNVEIFRLKEHVSHQALDGTHKFLWDLSDKKTIESVIIPAALQEKKSIEGDAVANDSSDLDGDDEEFAEGQRFSGRQTQANIKTDFKRLTACISSQVGCAMACKFCLTGVQGLDRHLEAHEIVTQVYELRRVAPITNIVFMGMGEPLHNLQNVIKACKIMLDQDGLNFSKRKITVSTSGLVPAIEELGKNVDISLAISLNASNDEQRSAIMPVNKKWNIETLMNACRNYPLGPHRRITFEYVMLKDFNDTLDDAARVVKLIRGIPSKLNLIPFNEHSGSVYKRPSDETVKKFQRFLLDRNVTATVRISRGRDISAACGQLRSIFGTARGSERHKDWAPGTATASGLTSAATSQTADSASS
jgi:23S rRNA (adenine2503-C2)-methyltransferase